MDTAPDEDDLAAPRPLITLDPVDLDFWGRTWDVERDALAGAVRRYGPSVTAVARALGKPARI